MIANSIATGLTLALLVLGVGCTTSQRIVRPGGVVEYIVGCGAGTGWNVCYEKANELCPGGYTTISEVAGFNRKELRISCPASAKTAAGKS